MDDLSRDLRLAVRSLLQTPWVTAAIVLSLGLGVGANTTVFAWMDTILRRPFPAIPDGRQLVALNVADGEGKVQGMPPIAQPMFDTWRAASTSFADIAAHSAARLNVRETGVAVGDPVWTQIVTGNFFATLRSSPAIGRAFDAGDASSRAGVVVIGHEFWQRRFGGQPGILGRSLLFNGIPLTVIGVMPRGFGGVVVGLRFDAWVPIWQQPALMTADWSRDRRLRRLQAVARLRPGVTLEQANDELLRVARTESRDAGDTPVAGAAARWVVDTQLGSLMGPLGLGLTAIAAIVLLAACANVAGLQLARAAAHHRQTAVRVALGASRARLVREALTQSGILVAAGCGAGVLLAFITKGALAALVPRVALPVDLPIAFGWRVTGFAVAIAVAAGVMFGILPAWRSASPNVIEAIRTGSGAKAAAGRARRALVIAQVAFSVITLATAGIVIRSLRATNTVPLGFAEPRTVMLMSTDLSFTGRRGDALAAVVERWLAAIRVLSGVEGAALASVVPLSFGGAPAVPTRVEGYTPAPGEAMFVGRVVISDGYFDLMEIPIVDGRPLDAGDTASRRRVAVVNAALAARFWPGQSAIGHRVDQGDGWAEIVGVARDARMDSLTEPVRPLAYHALPQTGQMGVTLHVRSRAEAGRIADLLRRATATVLPDLPLLDPGTLQEHIGAATFIPAVGARVLTIMGVIAVFMTATGLYGLLSALVDERRREIAVSVALGATPRTIVAGIVGPVIRLAVAGGIAGAAGAIAVSILLRNQLVGVSRVDTASLVIVAGMIAVVVGATSLQPVSRALRINPFTTLRSH